MPVQENPLIPLVVSSVTLNMALLAYGLVVKILDHECLRSSTEKEEKSKGTRRKGLKQQSRRIAKSCINMISSLCLPVAGFYLFIATDISTNPFSTFNKSFQVVFAIQLAFYMFLISWRIFGPEDLLEYLHELLHHIIAIALYVSILLTGENSLLGLIGLLMNGSLIFYEVKTLLKITNPAKFALVYKSAVFLHGLFTCILRVIFPIILLVVSLEFSSKKPLFRMHSMSIAFFFLSVIFFTVYNIWYVKQTLSKCFKEIEMPDETNSNGENIGDADGDGCDVKVNTCGSVSKSRKERSCAKKSVLWDGNLTKNPRIKNQCTFSDHVFGPSMPSSYTNENFTSENVFVIDVVSEETMPISHVL